MKDHRHKDANILLCSHGKLLHICFYEVCMHKSRDNFVLIIFSFCAFFESTANTGINISLNEFNSILFSNFCS